MTINPINNKQSFIFKPLKIVQSLGWVAVAILALPTVIGSYFAWKKLAAVWSEKERPDTQKTAEVASETLIPKTTEGLLRDWVERAPTHEDRLTAQERILSFLEDPADLLDLSNLNLSSLPSIFEDKRFSKLQEINLIGNSFIGSLFIGNKSIRTIFKESPFKSSLSLDKEDFVDLLTKESTKKPLPTLLELKREQYERAIAQFKTPGCLGPCSAEAYLDYLKNTEKNLGFYFNTNLLYNTGIELDKFLTNLQAEIKEASSLAFVPFLLAGNLLREQHIVVAVINLKDEKIEYFDPKGNQLYSWLGSLADRNLAQWNIPSQKFLEKLSRSVFPHKNPSIIRNINGPQPLSNKVHCGAHALDFIQVRMNTDFTKSSNPNYFETSLSSDGEQLRSTMAATLQNRLDTGQIDS